jgi:hypothetical protein
MELVFEKIKGQVQDEYSDSVEYSPKQIANFLFTCDHETYDGQEEFTYDEQIIEIIIQYYEDCMTYSNNPSYTFIKTKDHQTTNDGMSEEVVDAFNEYQRVYNSLYKHNDLKSTWEEYKKSRQIFHSLLRPIAEAVLNDLRATYKYSRMFEIGDDCPLGLTLEHGQSMYDIFNEVIKVSNH